MNNKIVNITSLIIISVIFLFNTIDSKAVIWEKVPGTLDYVNFLKFSDYFKQTLYVGSDAQPTDFTTNNITFPFFGDGFQISKNLGSTFSTSYLSDYSIYDLIEVISQEHSVLAVSARKQDFGRVILSTDLGISWDLETKRCESPAQITRFNSIKEDNKYIIYASAINSNSGFRYSDNFFADCNLSSGVNVNTRDISVSKKNPSVIYLAADNVSKQKVLVSKDKGESWIDASKGLENYRILSIQVSPTDESTVVIGADSVSPTGKIVGMGIFVSNDFGANWRNVGAVGASVYDIQFHPSNPKYWAAAGGDKGVFVSGTGGDYWESSTDGLPNGFFARKVAIPDVEPTSSGIIVFASIYGQGIYKSQHITTSVGDDYTDTNLHVYPNPAIESINLVNCEEYFKYELVDIFGNQLLSGSISNSSYIDISNFQNGTYLIVLRNNYSTKTIKFNKVN